MSGEPGSDERQLRLEAGSWSLVLLPDLGGAVHALEVGGLDVLRPRMPGATDPLQMAAFPLVPYCNRLANGRLAFGGHQWRVRPNHPPEPNALHGIGWLAPWTVADAQASTATLVQEYPGGADWPWAYLAWQRFTLDDAGLLVELGIENRAGEPAPAGIGWHPYFPAPGDARVEAKLDGVWLTDELIPVRYAPAATLADLSDAPEVGSLPFIDHCYRWSAGQAILDRPEGRVTIEATAPFDFLHVYAPGLGFVCLEPVSHMPDAANRPEPPVETGWQVLAPGERLAGSVRLRWEAAAG